MKIALFVNSAKTFFWHRRSLADRLIQEGHDVHIVCSTADDVSRFNDCSYKVHFVSMSRKGRNPLSELKVFFRLLKIFKSIEPDLCHNFTIKCVIYGSLIQRSLGIHKIVNSITGLGIVFTRDDFFQKCIRNLYRFVFKFSRSKIIFQNPDDRDLFIKDKIITSKNHHALILGSGVNIQKFIPGKRDNSLIKIVFASRLLRSKGVLDLIKSSVELMKEGFSHELLIAGEADPMSPDAITLEDLSAYKKWGHIHFLGNIIDMPELLSKCHIACFPSYYREGVPKFLIESASAGLAIVTTDSPGCREVVSENGIKVPVKDVYSLTNALRSLLSDPSLINTFGHKSRNLAVNKFSEEKILNQILEFYSS